MYPYSNDKEFQRQRKIKKYMSQYMVTINLESLEV